MLEPAQKRGHLCWANHWWEQEVAQHPVEKRLGEVEAGEAAQALEVRQVQEGLLLEDFPGVPRPHWLQCVAGVQGAQGRQGAPERVVVLRAPRLLLREPTHAMERRENGFEIGTAGFVLRRE